MESGNCIQPFNADQSKEFEGRPTWTFGAALAIADELGVAFAFSEAVNEDCAMLEAERHQDSMAVALAPPRTGEAVFE